MNLGCLIGPQIDREGLPSSSPAMASQKDSPTTDNAGHSGCSGMGLRPHIAPDMIVNGAGRRGLAPGPAGMAGERPPISLPTTLADETAGTERLQGRSIASTGTLRSSSWALWQANNYGSDKGEGGRESERGKGANEGSNAANSC